jgi:peptide/nickel transport system ATP-binding protein
VARRHNIPRKSVQAILCERLVAVGLADTTRVLSSYPHQLSGGMLQRCMIAMALITNPKLLIADEPTTALDTTIARQILSLMLKLQEEHGFAMILISHDVEIISDLSDDIAVLYAGKIVETGPTSEVVNHPSHPYTTGLLGAIPQAGIGRGELAAIPGQVPSSSLSITGCAFAPRCQHRLDICESEPTIVQINDHKVACWMGQS